MGQFIQKILDFFCHWIDVFYFLEEIHSNKSYDFLLFPLSSNRRSTWVVQAVTDKGRELLPRRIHIKAHQLYQYIANLSSDLNGACLGMLPFAEKREEMQAELMWRTNSKSCGLVYKG